jgi:hypothetical protein
MPGLLATTAMRLRLMLLAGDRGRIVAGGDSVKGRCSPLRGMLAAEGSATRELAAWLASRNVIPSVVCHAELP